MPTKQAAATDPKQYDTKAEVNSQATEDAKRNVNAFSKVLSFASLYLLMPQLVTSGPLEETT
jgi:hypothetical protein